MARKQQSESEPQFTGFPAGSLRFFDKLARNNDREWFAARKGEYEANLLAPMLLLVRDLAIALHEAGLPLEAARRSPVHRIYRDIRFPKDKRPFHTHISTALYREGDKHMDGVVYVHLDAKQPFAAAGFWEPDKASLRRWRDSLVDDPAPLVRIHKQLTLETEGALQRMPRGYEAHAESPAAPLLRLKHYVVRQELLLEELGSRAVLASLVRFARSAAPLLNYGWELEEAAPELPARALQGRRDAE